MVTNPSSVDHHPPSSVYDLIADVYDETRRLPDWLPNRLADQVLEIVAAPSRPQFLELGVGTGRIAQGFLRPGVVGEYVGLDISTAMLAELSAKFGSQLTVVHGEASRLPFPDNSFDVVISCHVLQMIADLPRALAEVRRVLRSGGCYVHCTDELAPHQQEFDQIWQAILVREDPGYSAASRYDMRREDVIAHWSQAAFPVRTVEVATWHVSHRISELIAAYEAKAYPSCHKVSDAVFKRAIDRLRQHSDEHYGDLSQELSSQSRMDIVVAWMPQADPTPSVSTT